MSDELEQIPSSTTVITADKPYTPMQRDFRHLYSAEQAETILDLYIQGKSLHAISKVDNMPSYPTLLRWAHEHEEFSKKFETARKVRALHIEEKILDKAESADCLEKDAIAAQRLQFDMLRWATETHDGERFGKKTTISGDVKRPIQIIVNTGVPDPEPLPTPKDVEIVEKVLDAEFKEVEAQVDGESSGDNN